jgi:heptosyltransferase-1
VLKRLEQFWRRLWIRILTALMKSPRSRPDWTAGPHKILFLRHDRIGDMIVSTPAIRIIAESHPGFELHVLASPANAQVLENARHVARVIRFDRRKPAEFLSTLRALRRERYDVVIDCMVTAPSVTTLLLMLATNAPYRIGIAGRGNDDAINVPVPAAGGEQPMPIEIGALVRAFGIDPSTIDWRPEIEMGPDALERAAAKWRSAGSAGGQRVLVNVSAGTAIRQWQVERYAEVIAHLRTRLPDAIVLVAGAPGDEHRVAIVASSSRSTAVATPRLMDAFALVATADFVFTPDTSIAHAASAFGPKTVVMHRVGEPRRWGLYPGVGEDVENTEPTLLTLEVPTVLAAIDRVLARRG